MSTFSFFQLIFDNYSKAAVPPSASPATSYSKRIADDALLDDSSSVNLNQLEIAELRQQLQATKKQSLIFMEQSRKSSEREKMAFQQAQEALKLKVAAVAEALQATSRENYMLDLLTDASLDMAGKSHLMRSFTYFAYEFFGPHIFLIRLGSFLDAAAEDQRVDARTEILVRLAQQNNSSFWSAPDRTRQIVRFQDRASQVREYLDFCTKTLAMVYNAMFPRNLQPKTLPELINKFKSV